jgi:hypothetical protein
MDKQHVREQQKRRAWRRGILAALVLLLLLCVGSFVWTYAVRLEGDEREEDAPPATLPVIVRPTPTP